jgi:RNA polymerase II-associated protein 1
MAIAGQRFELDLDADDFAFTPIAGQKQQATSDFGVKDVLEHNDTSDIPPAPSLRSSKSGFPEHKQRRNVSAFKRTQAAKPTPRTTISAKVEPSDQAIKHHIGQKYGLDMDADQKAKAEISEENKRRIAEMSAEDIEEARAELMGNLNPAFLQRLLQRASIEEDQEQSAQEWPEGDPPGQDDAPVPEAMQYETPLPYSTTHFPVPPNSSSDYQPLDPSSPTFLSSLRETYFPSTPHDPSTLNWLQDPTQEEEAASQYNPDKPSFAPSTIRFGFTGRLIPPKESLEISVKDGLHHHGDDPSSAGYTIPELSLLARSTLPNQRCVAYQLLGRILYRLGRGDFGPRGSELQEAIWGVIENERSVEVMMSEANRLGGHASAKAHATEALWLWRKGGGGDRGVLKPGQKLAK